MTGGGEDLSEKGTFMLVPKRGKGVSQVDSRERSLAGEETARAKALRHARGLREGRRCWSAGRVRGQTLTDLPDNGEDSGFCSQGDGRHWSILSRSDTIQFPLIKMTLSPETVFTSFSLPHPTAISDELRTLLVADDKISAKPARAPKCFSGSCIRER